MWKLIDTPEKERQHFFHVVNLLAIPSEQITKPESLTVSIIQQVSSWLSWFFNWTIWNVIIAAHKLCDLTYFIKAETEVKRLDELKTSKMKELFVRKQFELQEICSRSHMEIPSPSEMENITHLVDSGKRLQANILINPSCYFPGFPCQLSSYNHKMWLKGQSIWSIFSRAWMNRLLKQKKKRWAGKP